MDKNLCWVLTGPTASGKTAFSIRLAKAHECEIVCMDSMQIYRKMNIGTDVCCAFAEGNKAALEDPNRSLAVDVFMKGAIASVKALAADKIELCGAAGKVN